MYCTFHDCWRVAHALVEVVTDRRHRRGRAVRVPAGRRCSPAAASGRRVRAPRRSPHHRRGARPVDQPRDLRPWARCVAPDRAGRPGAGRRAADARPHPAPARRRTGLPVLQRRRHPRDQLDQPVGPQRRVAGLRRAGAGRAAALRAPAHRRRRRHRPADLRHGRRQATPRPTSSSARRRLQRGAAGDPVQRGFDFSPGLPAARLQGADDPGAGRRVRAGPRRRCTSGRAARR